MRINTNVSSITAQEAAANTNNAIKNSLEKLSSGLRINKASDDASGLAIADKLRTQATSLNQGVANGNSAVSLLQIADKSMAEQSNILDTVKAKLIQANTDTTSDDGREAIRKDISKLLEQLDNIAEQTNYNGNVLLQSASNDQSASEDLNFQIGESKNDIIQNTAIQSNTIGLGGGNEAIANNTEITSGSTVELSATGTISLTTSGTAGSGAENVRLAGKVGEITANNEDITIKNVDAKTKDTLDLMIANGTSGLTYNAGTQEYTLTAGNEIDFEDQNVARMDVTGGTASGTIDIDNDGGIVKVTNLQNGATDENLLIKGTNITGGDTLSSLANLKENGLTKELADKFQGVVDNAITDLNSYRGDIGSTQNQVESAVRNLMTQSTNVKAAESIIRDVDYAAESANFNKQNIISQAGSYAISQANSVQQNVLRLLQ